MQRTTVKDDILYYGDVELTHLMVSLIRQYRYGNKNADPKAIVIPIISKVGDVDILYEEYGDVQPKGDRAGTGKDK